MTALGFGPSPRPRYIYLNRQYPDCLWYFWDHAGNKPEPILHAALTGILTKIEITDKEFRGKPDTKLDFYIKADRAYKIQVGFDTLTAKSLLSALTLVPDLAQPMTIAPEPGDTDSVVFGKVAIDGEILYAPYSESANWPEILQALIDRLPRSAATHPASGASLSAPIPSAPQSTAPTPKLPTLPTAAKTDNLDQPISDADRAKFVAIVREQRWTNAAVTAYLGSCGYTNSRLILNRDFISISNGIREADICDHFHGLTDVEAVSTLPLGTWESAA